MDIEATNWTPFYEAMANALLQYRYDRSPLAEAIADIHRRRPDLPFAITDQFPDGSADSLQDICPFTAMGIFNRRLTDANRGAIADELAQALDVAEPIPDFSTNENGIPLLPALNSWLFDYARIRQADAIDNIWQAFADAIMLADGDAPTTRSAFIHSYDVVQAQPRVSYNITMGLYWIRPWYFLSLERNSRKLITDRLAISLPNKVPSGSQYMALRDRLVQRFPEPDFPIHSFPELSWAAYQPDLVIPVPPAPPPPLDASPELELEPKPERVRQPYVIENILADGCFLPQITLESMLHRFQTKQNIILQGPPGAGKTWLSKRLAYALIGRKDDDKVRQLQFHPNLSYEDFVRGWRPDGEGALVLADGPFLKLAEDARNDPDGKYVMVIEEINRGNPASIFGELLTLLEADKRSPNDALALAYPHHDGERFHIPPNVYVIGTMNLADRSLALVDFALRRRFAFFDLEPQLNDAWREWVNQESGIPTEFLADIAGRITALNDQIAADRYLGPQFRVGHSHVTPHGKPPNEDHTEWFAEIVETEIAPLLREYWFDDPNRAEDESEKLLIGL